MPASRPVERWVRLPHPLDLRLTLGIHRHGTGDPTMRLGIGAAAVAMHTSSGSATLELRRHGADIHASAWGPGADAAIEGAPALVGDLDEPETFDPPIGLVRELHRRLPGLRMSRSGRVLAALVPAILEQKVTGLEARRAWRGLVRLAGAPAPGPHRLLLPPAAETLAALPYPAFHRLGVERRRAEAIRSAARAADRLHRAATDDRIRELLGSLPGVGAWTVAEVSMAALGDPDAVSVGDYHLKHHVSWALAGERRGTDERMLELLEPYRGQRGRVCRLIGAAGLAPPRRAPRMPVRSIAAL